MAKFMWEIQDISHNGKTISYRTEIDAYNIEEAVRKFPLQQVSEFWNWNAVLYSVIGDAMRKCYTLKGYRLKIAKN